jgi:hypothetical protein
VAHWAHRMLVAAAGVATALALSLPAAAATDSDHDGLRNSFETTRSHTDPHNADTGKDGLLDPAEDPDGDGLSNLGEQRFGTDPLSQDTDGDGIPDGREDANGNGISNATEQDRRPIPRHLVPSLAAAPGDASISYRCHSGPYESRIHPCVFGDRNGHATIVIFGDSHAAQWVPGLIPPAKATGWQIVTLTKSGCPSARIRFEEPNFPGAEQSCNRWRRRGVAWIGSHQPDVVILASSRGYVLIDARGHRLTRSQSAKPWRKGLAQTLGSLPDPSKAVVLSDTPSMRKDVPQCLSANRNRISACERPRSKAIPRVHVDAEKAAAVARGAVFASMNAVVCPYDPCPLIVGHFLMWRNASHLTATYARQLAPSVGAMVSRILSRSGSGEPVATGSKVDLELPDMTSIMRASHIGRD